MRSKPEAFLDLKLSLAQGRAQLLDHPEALRELRMLESKRTSGGAEVTLVTFLFRNDTRRVVKLPGYFGMGPKDGFLRVNFTEYEVQVAGKWEPLDVGYCGIPEYYPVQPDNELRALAFGAFHLVTEEFRGAGFFANQEPHRLIRGLS